MGRVGRVGEDAGEPTGAQHAVHLQHRLPGHGEVLEHRHPEHRVEAAFGKELAERVRVAHHVHVLPRDHVEPDIVGAGEPPALGGPGAGARADLEHPWPPERIHLADEALEHLVRGFGRDPRVERPLGELNRPQEQPPPRAAEHGPQPSAGEGGAQLPEVVHGRSVAGNDRRR